MDKVLQVPMNYILKRNIFSVDYTHPIASIAQRSISESETTSTNTHLPYACNKHEH